MILQRLLKHLPFSGSLFVHSHGTVGIKDHCATRADEFAEFSDDVLLLRPVHLVKGFLGNDHVALWNIEMFFKNGSQLHPARDMQSMNLKFPQWPRFDFRKT